LSLVEFDDKSPLELLELLNKVLGSLDEKHNKVDIRNETQDATSERVTGFLKGLGFPADFNVNMQRNIVQGEKKTIHLILFWLLTRLSELKRKAYIAKFLEPIDIPDEFMVDEEIGETLQVYKDLQAEF
jgi:intraflagellar transport protein 81